MDELGVNLLPIVRGERLIGVLTREQVLRSIRNRMELDLVR
jgi:CBS domain-containing protein